MHRRYVKRRVSETRKRIIKDAKKMIKELKMHYDHFAVDFEYRAEERKARKRVKEMKGYYSHLATYISVNLFLFLINLMLTPSFFWCVFPLLGWGLGMFLHTVSIFGIFGIGGKKWEEQKLQELLGHSATREEIEHLSQRIESLATIISSVNWEKIDLDIATANKSLLNAHQTIQQELIEPNLQLGNMRGLQKDRLEKLIENLETIVTSPEFNFIDTDYATTQQPSPRTDD